MNLQELATQSFDIIPPITSLRNHFSTSDKSIYLTPDYIISPFSDKMANLASNFIKLYHTAKDKFPKEFPDVLLLLDTVSPLGPHFLSYNGFYPPLKLLASEEQLPKWEKLVLEGRLVGAYAQTEISHGSDVQSLQTIATYNKDRKCFVMNSPTIGSTKFWVGVLGIQCTHAILQAQTFVNGKSYGLQTFIVPIRDPKTYKLYDGVDAGDIGAKLGLAMMDNGFLRMKDYAIPRENLLMRFIKVEEDGTVKQVGDENAVKIGYGGMLGLRVQLLRMFLKDGYKALMVWIHSVRKQGEMSSLLKRRLLREFADVYCGILTVNGTNRMYRNLLVNIKGNHKKALGELEELHLIAAGFKPYFAWSVLAQMRRIASFHSISGLQVANISPQYADKVPAPTYEGDNLVMLQQTARGLLKYMKFVEMGTPEKIPQSFKFLWDLRGLITKTGEAKRARIEREEELNSLEIIEELIDRINMYSVGRNFGQFTDSLINGQSQNMSWNEKLQGNMIKMALGVMRGLTFKMAKNEFLGTKLLGKDAEILGDLIRVYGLEILLKEIDFAYQFDVGVRSGDYERLVRGAQENVYRRLEGQLGYLMDSGYFKDEELVFVRDFQKWEVREDMRDNVQRRLKELAGKVQKDLGSFSKL